jgi:hypothetical protein
MTHDPRHASRICVTAAQSLAASRPARRDQTTQALLTDEQRDRMTASAREVTAALVRDPQAEAERSARRASAAQRRIEHDERWRRAEYLRAGLEPPTNEHGVTMSLGVARSTGAVLRKIAGGEP